MNLECDACKQTFSSLDQLRDHEGREHDAPWDCLLCGQSIKLSCELKHHIYNHLGQSSDGSNRRTDNYVTHSMLEHPGEKIFKCDMCHRIFITSHHLKKHKSVHTGAKPFKVNICNSRTRPYSLERRTGIQHYNHDKYYKKDKRKAYAVKDKLDLVQRVKGGDSQARICRESGVPEGTLRGWLKDEEKLKKFALKMHGIGGLNRKRTKTACAATLDTSLFEWFSQARSAGSKLNGNIIKIQAMKLSRELSGPDDDFQASEGWLWRFQRRHGITSFNSSDESQSADREGARAFPEKLLELIETEGYDEEQVYNADESGLNYKMFPTRTLPTVDNKARVTILLTCNKTGSHKLKPFMIGKAKNPSALHNINKSTLPVLYESSKNSTMTAALFEEWFFDHFVPEVRKFLRSRHLEEKAVLLLDNCPAHPPVSTLRSHNGKIKAYLLPKDTTSLGIIEAAKAHYRRNMLNALIESGMQSTDYLKTVSIKDAMFWFSGAWKKVTKAAIGVAFGDKPFNGLEQQLDATDAVEKLKTYAVDNSIDTDHISVSNAVPAAENSTVQELIADALGASSSSKDGDDDDDVNTEPAGPGKSIHSLLSMVSDLVVHWKHKRPNTMRLVQLASMDRELREELNDNKQVT